MKQVLAVSVSFLLVCLSFGTVYGQDTEATRSSESFPTISAAPSFIWPVTGNDHHVAFYMDHDNSSGVEDFNCGNLTYNGHKGTDITLYSFYSMDEGVPIIAAASGTVSNTHDGDFDRNTSKGGGGFGNHVELTHDNGYKSIYGHMRKGSVRVNDGQNIEQGDTLGLIGSSGNSESPHLHFEVKVNGGTVDPYDGNCYVRSTDWAAQPTYAGNAGFEIIDYGITSLNLDLVVLSERPPTKTHFKTGQTFNAWIIAASTSVADVFSVKIFQGNSKWKESAVLTQTAGALKWSFGFFTLPNGSGKEGDWRIEYYRNGQKIAEDNFVVDGANNQPAVVTSDTLVVAVDGVLTAELSGTDADGANLFWYTITDQPDHGTLEVSGGGRRKITYTPNAGYKGYDSFDFYVTDDENLDGQSGTWTIDVGGENNTHDPIENDIIPSTMKLSTFPNPFTNNLSLSWHNTKYQETKIQLFDVTGRLVRVLFDHAVPAGVHQQTWQIEDLPAGTYFCRIEQDGVQTVKAVIHTRR